MTYGGQVIDPTAYIYAGELLVCPPFGLQRVISLAPLRVISLSTFLGAIFAL